MFAGKFKNLARSVEDELKLVAFASPDNQFYFWPEYCYEHFRKGQNAIFIVEVDVPSYSMKGWFNAVLTGAPGPPPADPLPRSAPEALKRDFDSVTDLGIRPALYHGRIYRWVQIFECRNLR